MCTIIELYIYIYPSLFIYIYDYICVFVCVCVYAGPPKTEISIFQEPTCVFQSVSHSLSLSLYLSLSDMRLGTDMVALRDFDVLDDKVP